MGLQIITIETQEQYQEYINYINQLHNLLLMNPTAIHILELINQIRIETKIWENK